MTKTDISTPLVQAFTFAWSAIQENHPDVPDVVITFGGGKPGVLGHFAAHRWAAGDRSINEIFVGAEGLNRSPQEVMATLLHEAAHGVALTRDLQDVSRGGRYHNGRFRDLAEELGIEVQRHQVIGWSITTLPAATEQAYAESIERLESAMVAYRKSDLDVLIGGLGGLIGGGGDGDGEGDGESAFGRGRRRKSSNGVVLTCQCEKPRRIRVSLTVAEAGQIACGICGAEFADPDDGDEDDEDGEED
jgi:hypothetical protein